MVTDGSRATRRRGRPARSLAVAAVVVTAGIASGCSSGHSGGSAAPGRASGTGTTAAVPDPDPCRLVDSSQAQSVLGQPVTTRVAPLGPTCILSGRSGAVVATLAVQTGSVDQVRRQMSDVEVTTSGTHQLVCGTYGKTMLVTSVGGGSFLEIAAPCPAAQKLAGEALARLR